MGIQFNDSSSSFIFIKLILQESLVDVFGQITKTPSPVSSCTQSDVEIKIQKLFIVSASEPRLPLQMEDATRPDIGEETGGLAVVKLDTRLDNRFVSVKVFGTPPVERGPPFSDYNFGTKF